MRIALSALLISTLALSACQSRWNPVNWFGSDEPVPAGEVNPLLPQRTSQGLLSRPESVYEGTPVQKVVSVEVARTREGAIITATGVTIFQAAYAVKLQPRNDGKPEGGVITYDLLALQPPGSPYAGTEQSRTVTVAHALTNQHLEGVRAIQVVAVENARQARR